MDTKKLGRIPDGGGYRVLAWPAGKRNRPTGGTGYAYLHSAIDTAPGWPTPRSSPTRASTPWSTSGRAQAWFSDHDITLRRALTDNGNPYRSQLFRDALGPDVAHKRCRPYHPQTNGNVERFHRTLLEEWSCARPYASEAERVAASPAFLHTYNHRRGPTALGGRSPADRVNGLAGQNTEAGSATGSAICAVVPAPGGLCILLTGTGR